MARFIHFVDDQQRDAEVTFTSLNPKPKVRLVLPNGSEPVNFRVIKGTADTAVEALCDRLVGPAKPKKDAADLMREIELADHLIKGDPEVDVELHGKFISDSARVFVDQESKPVFHLKQREQIFDAQGELVEERTPKVFFGQHLRDRYGPVEWQDDPQKGLGQTSTLHEKIPSQTHQWFDIQFFI